MGERLQRIFDRKGFTLVEVMAAFFILMIAAEILMLGVSFSVQSGVRTERVERMGREAEEMLADKTNCVSGTVRLRSEDGEELVGDGWLYCGEISEDEPPSMNIIFVEEAFSGWKQGESREEKIPWTGGVEEIP